MPSDDAIKTERTASLAGAFPSADESPAAIAFQAHLRMVKGQVDGALATRLDALRVRLREVGGADLEVVADAMKSLVIRGGKRFRPALLVAAYEACGGEGGIAATLGGCEALELLQTYLLIHDDWMDGDDLRRGGPTVHAALRAHFQDAFRGDAFGILAGDMASSMAQAALAGSRLAPGRVLAASREFAQLQVDVVLGQMLDMQGAASTDAQMDRLHELKTGSYTVRGPLLMGAALAAASPAARASLERFARPVGLAFQVRDDLLGTFGDSAKTGKSDVCDLRRGKRTALLVEAEKDPASAPYLNGVVGVAQASEGDLAALRNWLTESGVRARVEARLSSLLGEARQALDDAPPSEFTALTAQGRLVLLGAVEALGYREQ